MRLPGYDYSKEGGYFVTVCTHNRACTLSRIHNGNEKMRASIELTELGCVVKAALEELSAQYGIRIEACSIMPNHIHMILIVDSTGVTVGRFIGALKSIVSNRWRQVCNNRNVIIGKLWQRDFYDHILRNEADYLEKWKYIDENPDKWMQDELYKSK